MLDATSRRSRLLARLHSARAETDALFGMVRPQFLFERPIAERHRLAFYIGHVDAFDWNLLSAPLGLASDRPALDTLFAFGIDPVDGQLPSDRPSDWPPLDEFFRYREHARALLDVGLDLDAPGTDRIDRLLHVAIEHRLMHAETLSYLLHRLPFDRKRGTYARAEPATQPPMLEMLHIPAGKTMLGARSSSGQFGWDNEFEAHAVDVPAFVIDKHKVTNAQYLAFLDASGYTRREFWSDADWAWKEASAITHPAFWLRQGGQWFWRSMFEPIPLPPQWPVYVSHAEASAYARWAGRALPTEAQWQRAAIGADGVESLATEGSASFGKDGVASFGADGVASFADGVASFGEDGAAAFGEGGGAAIDDPAGASLRFDPVAVDSSDLVDSSPFGVTGLHGNGWEWTSTLFAPFAGFRRFDFYPGYSEPFFDDKHFVLKGGSVRTAGSMLRPSFRNWFQAHYPYVYAGFRCANGQGSQ